MNQPVPIFIVGPSGVGKNSVIDRILGLFSDLEAFKTSTSRLPRPGETKYHFLSRQEFEQLINDGAMLEWTQTHGNLYGVQRQHLESVIDRGKYPVARNGIDVKGVPTYQQHFPGMLAIFLTFESLDQLADRIRRTRPGTSEQEITTRLATAQQEMAVVDQFKHVVVNREGKLNQTVDEVATVLERELNLRRMA